MQKKLPLVANGEVSRLLENNEDKNAPDLAVKYQLVTPVSGAVVLETAAQYEQFGLKPVEAGTAPTIPEPEEYLLFAIVIMIITWFGWQYRKKYKQAKLQMNEDKRKFFGKLVASLLIQLTAFWAIWSWYAARLPSPALIFLRSDN